MSITDKITSLQQQVNDSYRRPDPSKLKKYQEDLMNSTEAQDYLIVERNLTIDTIKNFGLGYDVERNAIAIPVFKRGELINIRYRFLNPEGSKYSQEKDCEVWIYNEDGNPDPIINFILKIRQEAIIQERNRVKKIVEKIDEECPYAWKEELKPSYSYGVFDTKERIIRHLTQ